MPRKPDTPCTDCGKLLVRYKKSADEMKCRDCRGISPVGQSPHGSPRRYRNGCRCTACKDYQRLRLNAYAQRFREEHGYLPSVKHRRGDKNSLRRIDWISQADRLAIYERDNWTCQLCNELVDREADRNTHWAPSLDHIIPRLFNGSDEPENLRLAHRICNAIRGAEEIPA